MTIKELASFTARTERTVRRWINKAEITSDTLTDKMTDAMRTNIPGDFDLNEIEEILRCSSLPKIVVDDLILNARKPVGSLQVTSEPNQLDVLLAFMERQQNINQQFMSTVLNELKGFKQQPLQIEQPKQDYFSLIAYTSLHKIKTNSSELKKMGMDLRKIALSHGKELHKIPDERYGQVNSYPVEVLEEYFSE